MFFSQTLTQLLIPLTSLVPNARHLLKYSPVPSSDDFQFLGGGLGVLLRLPRTAHFSGMLRLLSAIVFNLCETEAGLETKLEADLLRYFNGASELRRLYPIADDAANKVSDAKIETSNSEQQQETAPISITKSTAMSSASGDSGDTEMKTVGDDQQECSSLPASPGSLPKVEICEERVVALDKLIESMYPYLHRNPKVFKRVIEKMCCLYVEAPIITNQPLTSSCSSETSEESNQQQSTAMNSSLASACGVSSDNKEIKRWIGLIAPSVNNGETRNADVSIAASNVLPILIDYLDLLTSIHVSFFLNAV